MTLDLIPSAFIAENALFASEAAVIAANPVAPGSNMITVLRAGRYVLYRRLAGATDLIGGDLSTWQIADITIDDMTALAGDLVALAGSVVQQSGSWTPGLVWSGGSGSFTYGTREGLWQRVGAFMELRANLTVTIGSGGLGNLQLNGLPLATRAGDFKNTLEVDFDTTGFQAPYGGGNWKVRLAGGQTSGPFTFDAGTNFASYFVEGLTAVPIPNGSIVELGATTQTAQIVGFYGIPGFPTKGMVSLSNRYAEVTEGMTLNGVGWSGVATLLTNTWFGAGAGTSFLATAQVKRDTELTLEISGRVLI